MNRASDPPRSKGPAQEMLERLDAHFFVQAIHVAAALGIADLLGNDGLTVDELAQATGAHGPSLSRLLRLLASGGVFAEDREGHFTLTPLAATLRTDAPDSVRDRALFVAAPAIWAAWGQLGHSVRTGQSAFEHVHQMPFYDYLTTHPDTGQPFTRFMTSSARHTDASIVAAYDFSGFRTVVDVGGAQGATLVAILQAYPSLRGILFDLPQVVAQTTLLEAAGVAGRFSIAGGDMLRSVPAGGDAYLLKRILMDKPDDQAVQILRHCAEAMAERGRILVMDYLVPPGNDPNIGKLLNVAMLVLSHGGRIRTEAEFRQLFSAADLELAQVIPTSSQTWHGGLCILEGMRPRSGPST
jgi:O-methyltransferase domain